MYSVLKNYRMSKTPMFPKYEIDAQTLLFIISDGIVEIGKCRLL